MSKVRTNDGYKDIEAVYAGNIPIDAIYDKNGNILFSAYNEVSGASPLNFRSKSNNSSTLKNYRIYGNTVNGESVGDKSTNFFDESLAQNVTEKAGVSKWVHIQVGEGNFTLSTNMPNVTTSGFAANIFLLAGNVSTGANSATNGVTDNTPITVSSSDGYVTVGLRNANDYNPKDYNIMLNSGSEALPYEPYGYKVPVKIEGKNLLQNAATSQTINGVTFTVNTDGSVTCNGTPTENEPTYITINIPEYEDGEYILSGCPLGGSANTYYLQIYRPTSSTTTSKNDFGAGNTFIYGNHSGTTAVNIFVAFGYTCDNLTFYPMIRRAEIADGTYEPYHVPTTTNIYLPEQIKMVGDESEYIDFKEQKQYRVRKNLLQNTATSQTINGVTFTVNSDGSVTCNGTADAVIQYNINTASLFNITENVIISGCPSSGSSSTFLLRGLYPFDNIISNDNGNGVLIDRIGEQMRVQIRIASGYTCNNLTFYPMIRKSSISDSTYEPYITNTELDVTLPSISIQSGTSTLLVETSVQPSDIYLKGKIEKKPKIYYYSQDGQTLLYTEAVLKGSNGLYSGTPTKTADPQYTYTFAGWASSTGQTTATSGVRNNIQNDKNVYAAFSRTLNTYTVYFYNESDTPIETVQNVTYGGSATYSGATPTKTGTSTKEYIFTGWSPSPTNISGNTSCYAQYVELTQTITDSWQEILESSTDGTYTSKYAVGDTKIIDLGDEGKVAMEIVGIDTDDLSDNSGKAPITWISKQVLNVFHRMNPRYRAGVVGTGALGGWVDSEMRAYLKDDIKPLIPATIRNAIASVKKYTRSYNVSGESISNSLSIEDVWIPSRQEVSALGDFAYESSGVYYADAFPNKASRIKQRISSSQSAITWWLRSASSNSYFTKIDETGSYGSSDAGNILWIALGFCTGKLPTYTITYKSQDGQTTLYTENVIQGKNGTYNVIPTKSSTAQYDYTFVGWSTSANSTTATSGATQDIQSDKVVYAAFAETARTYTVTFYNGETQLGTTSVNYGSDAAYSGATPTKASTQQYEYYFLGWNANPSATTADADALANVTSDRTVYAIFEQTTRTYTVTFYNGDTPLETIYNIPYGGSATYSGSTPTKTDYTFTGWSPEPTNISGDTSCYAQFEAVNTGLITDSWETIASRAAAGTAQNYYSVGDCKAVTLNGTCGTLELNNVTLYVYILGFNHNSALEGTGITFGGFKTNYDNTGIDVALIDSHYESTDTTGLKWFDMNHYQGNSQYGHNYGGWKGCDMRYDILGSTDTAPSGYGATATTSNVGYDASSTCAISPVANTLMSCLPSDLRAVMKPMTKYTNNVGDGFSLMDSITASIDYLPLLAEYEIFGRTDRANQYEGSKQAQYAYYADSNNSNIKYKHSNTGSEACWWERSPYYDDNYRFCHTVFYGSGMSFDYSRRSFGIAPIFLVGLQTYTVSYYSQDGLTLLGTETVNNGQNAQGLAQNPTKASDTDYDYIFAGWNSQGNKTAAEANILNSITQNKTVYAAFEPVYKSDTISDSWEDIIESCSDGTYSSKYSVGDLKTIDLGTEGIVQMEIVGINADDKADDSGKAPITWISKQLLKTDHRMNPAKQGSTSGTGTLGGWEKTEMRSYLKETVKPLLPSEVRNALKTVKKYSKIYNASGIAVNNVVSNDDIWIPSAYEVNSSSYETSGVTYSTAFPDNASRIKHKVGSSAAVWWLRSAFVTTSFSYVGSNGSHDYGNAHYLRGVAVGFCT